MARFTMDDYQWLAQRTSPDDDHDRIDNAVMGLLGETGEIADLLKKYKYQSLPGTPPPYAKITEELGDVLWYAAELATGLEKSLQEIAGGDFLKYEDAAASPAKRKRQIDRVILGLCDNAHNICFFAKKDDFERVEGYMRKLLVSAACLAHICGSCLRETAEGNIEKLRRRYPAGFDAKISMGRYKQK